MQQSLQKATFALAVKSQVETKAMLTDSIDAIALVGHVASELSALRRVHLKLSLKAPANGFDICFNILSILLNGNVKSVCHPFPPC